MAEIRAYTTIEQSRKLAEILPLESADMMYHSVENEYGSGAFVVTSKVITNGFKNDDFYIDDIPCWSLATLFNYLREIDFFPDIEADEHGVKMNISYYDEKEGNLLNPVHEIKVEADNFIDACYEFILKLHGLKIL